MRLFATGAMSWVMGKALPDDMPIDSKMVTKSIEKAQNTVEAKNAEVRKELLKYDEAYDKQRKEIYARRLQIIDGEDLKEYTEELLSETIARIVADDLPDRVRRGVGHSGPHRRGDAVLPDEVHGRRSSRSARAPNNWQKPADRGLRVLRGARGPSSVVPERARELERQHHAADHRRSLAGAPHRARLPARGHPPSRARPDRPARSLAARGLRDVRPALGGHRRRLPPARVPRELVRARGRMPRPTSPRPRIVATEDPSDATAPAVASGSSWGGPGRGRAQRTGGSDPRRCPRRRRSRREPRWCHGAAVERRRRRRPGLLRAARRCARQASEDRAQRPVPVWERQEVQALSRRQLTVGGEQRENVAPTGAPGTMTEASVPRDFTAELETLRSRLDAAKAYLRLAELSARLAELEDTAGRARSVVRSRSSPQGQHRLRESQVGRRSPPRARRRPR